MRGRGTYDKLVHSAGLLFQDNGYVAVSIRDIVSAVSVPKGTFYHYFASKEALASLIVGQKFRELDSSLSELDDDARLLSGIQRHLRALGNASRSEIVSPVRLMGTLATESSVLPLPLRVLVKDSLRGWTDRLAILLGRAQSRGDIILTTDVHVFAVVLVNNLLGATIRMKCDSGTARSQALAQIALGKLFIEKKAVKTSNRPLSAKTERMMIGDNRPKESSSVLSGSYEGKRTAVLSHDGRCHHADD